MARPERNNVDYFPFICKEGKAMYYIEQKYNNDGYATWVKLLRQLAVTNYHFLNLGDEVELMHLASKCKVSEEVLINIINDLVLLRQFNKLLWTEYKIIWCQDFVDSIQDAYNNRKNKCIHYLGLLQHLRNINVIQHGKPLAELPETLEPIACGEQFQQEEEYKEPIIKTENWLSIEEYNDYREHEFSLLDEDYIAALKLKVGITRPYTWVNKKHPTRYFDLVDCIIRVRDDVEWRGSIQQNKNITKEKFLSLMYEFVKEIKDSTIYMTYDGFDGGDGKDNFKSHFTHWVSKKI